MHSHSNSRGFTLVEILVVIAIVAVLAAVIGTVSRKAITRGHAIQCASNLRQIGLATMMYAGDNQMTLPVTSHQRRSGVKSWTLTLQPYASGTITFKCPKEPDAGRGYTYLINDFLTPNPAGAPELNYSRLAMIDRPSETLLFAEASPAYRNADHFHFSAHHGGPVPVGDFEAQVATAAHGEQANYLFADGHAETLSRNEVLRRLAADGSCFIDPSNATTPEP